MRILVTGAAGFIGFHIAETLLRQGHEVVGLDNLNAYYDPALKRDRLARLEQHKNFSFVLGNLEDQGAIETLFATLKPERVIHLAAQAGVRHSINHPHEFIQSNVVGFLNILEGCRQNPVEHLVFASSSSVYGVNSKLPYCESDPTDRQASLYGATKKSNELMAHAYAHLYGLPVTGLRFFTVYGPWGRPDMAPMLFTRHIIEGRPIEVYNNGQHSRDFTYISDVIEGVIGVFGRIPEVRSGSTGAIAASAPFRIYNLGNNHAVQLMDFIACIEDAVGKKAIKNFLPMQRGDVLATYASIDEIASQTGFKPSTSIEEGIPHLVAWFRDYYRM